MDDRSQRRFINEPVGRWQGPERRWGAGERADIAQGRERLLDAARFCFERFGPVSTSMVDIAAQAKVTRPTVYRYFKSRQEVLDGVLLRELNRFWRRLDRQIGSHDHFGDHLVAALAFTLQCATAEKSVLFAPAMLPHLGSLLLADAAAPGMSQHPAYIYALRPGARPPADLPVAVEWFNRLALSYLERPWEHAKGPLLEELLAQLCPWARQYTGGGR